MAYVSISVGILVLGGLLACAAVTVESDAKYLTVRSSLLRVPLMQIKVRHIDYVAIEAFQKWRWGGWGIRWKRDGKAIIVRGTEAVVIQMTDATRRVIVMRPAAEVNRLLEGKIKRTFGTS